MECECSIIEIGYWIEKGSRRSEIRLPFLQQIPRQISSSRSESHESNSEGICFQEGHIHRYEQEGMVE